MRIGLFTDTYPPYINGVSTSVFMLKKALEKKGHQVYVVTVNDNSLKYQFEENKKVIRIPGLPTGIYDYRFSRIYPVKIVKIIKKWKLDVIHSHTEFGIGIFARLLAKQFNIPLVHTYHTMYEDYIHYITKGYFDRSSKKIVEYLTLFYCDKTAKELIVPTEKTYHLFKDKYHVNKNIHIVPTGIEVERFYKENIDVKKVEELRKKYKVTPNDFVLLFVGRLAKEKNVEFLIDVHRDLVKKNKSMKLIIVGDGPGRDDYEQLARKYKTIDQVIFTGKVPWEEVPNFYQLANLFVTASTSETQGLTVVEAMAAGIVPICVDDSAFRTVVVNALNGMMFKNKRECKNAIESLYKKADECYKMAQQARITAEHCSSKHYAENVLDVYNMAINGKDDKYGWISVIVDKIRRS